MFVSSECINGLAHGIGMAVTLDGDHIVPNGRFVLGRLVEGEVLTLPEDQDGNDGGQSS